MCNIVKIQSLFRGYIVRLKQLPLIMYKMQKYLKSQKIQFSNDNADGRINSCFDEDEVIRLLIERFDKRIIKPEKDNKKTKKTCEKEDKPRMWYDMLAFDYMYGWIPINVKSTTTKTSDNIGNLSTCVYSYTDEQLDIHRKNTYENGKMSDILFKKLKDKKYNTNPKKDYYFLVLNKTDASDIIVNSIKGLTILTPNINNLPFQVCWDKNRSFKYEKINRKIKMFIECLRKPNPSWKETFMSNIRTIDL